LGVSTTFWAQSTTINIRALIVLFTALCFYYLHTYLRTQPNSRHNSRALTGLALSFGLLVSHHYPQAAFAPVLAAVILWHDPGLLRRVRAWPRYLVAFALPFLANLYIWVRATSGAPFGTTDLVDARRILDHLMGRGFSGDMFAFLRPERVLWERVLVVGNILHFQFEAVLLALAVVGFAWLAWKRHKLAFLLGGTFLVMAFIVATYRAPQSVEYLMPAYIPIALGIGCATAPIVHMLAAPAKRWHGPLSAILTAAVLLPVFLLGRAHLPSYVLLHQDRSTREYAEDVLLNAPPHAHILSNWHWYTPLRYLQLVEGQRPDVEVTYLYPQGATAMPQAWPQRITRELETAERPLIVTNYYPTYGDLPYRLLPHGEAYLVQADPTISSPADLTPIDLDFGERIRLLGYGTSHPPDTQPGDWITVDLAWQPTTRLNREYAFFVQLIGPDGVPLGQRDLRHDQATTYAPGTVFIDRYRFPVFLAAPPGAYQLIAGVYWTKEDGTWERLLLQDGSDATTLSAVHVSPATLPPVTTHPLHRAFAGGPTLVGVDYDDTIPAQRRVYLHWRAGDVPTVARLQAGEQVIAQGPVPAADQGKYLTTALDVPPGTKEISLTVLDAGAAVPLPRQAVWGIARAASYKLPRPRPRQHYLPFGGKLALIGVRAHDVWPAGSSQRVALRFLGLRPIVRDYVVSVSVYGSHVIDEPSDSVPAIGAIPTFKWIRGSQVTDVHLFAAPPDESSQADLRLGVYDAFTTLGLPPLDERIARLGLATVPIQQILIP
jgi:hypothetical protein